MKVTVRLFASFAHLAGWRERAVEVDAGTTAGGVLEILRQGPLMVLPPGSRPLFSVNRRHVQAGHPLEEGDEVGVFPPVSGGAARDPIPSVVTGDPLDAAVLSKTTRDPGCGAIVTFEGTVRNLHEGRAVRAIEYEAYVDMATEVLDRIRDEVEKSHPGCRLALAHRFGRLTVGETSVVVACSAPHRRDAFAACRRAMDRIKELVPVWKHEEAASDP